MTITVYGTLQSARIACLLSLVTNQDTISGIELGSFDIVPECVCMQATERIKPSAT